MNIYSQLTFDFVRILQRFRRIDQLLHWRNWKGKTIHELVKSGAEESSKITRLRSDSDSLVKMKQTRIELCTTGRKINFDKKPLFLPVHTTFAHRKGHPLIIKYIYNWYKPLNDIFWILLPIVWDNFWKSCGGADSPYVDDSIFQILQIRPTRVNTIYKYAKWACLSVIKGTRNSNTNGISDIKKIALTKSPLLRRTYTNVFGRKLMYFQWENDVKSARIHLKCATTKNTNLDNEWQDKRHKEQGCQLASDAQPIVAVYFYFYWWIDLFVWEIYHCGFFFNRFA